MKDLGQTAESDESLATAASYLDKPLEMAPQKFHLVPGKGFQQAPEHGEAFWLALGKAHLQRGIWLWRIIERREFPESEREERLQEGIRHFAIATAYFSQYWQNSHAFVEGMNAFASRLQKAEVPAELARSVVQQVADEYQVNLDPLLETIDNVLGI